MSECTFRHYPEHYLAMSQPWCESYQDLQGTGYWGCSLVEGQYGSFETGATPSEAYENAKASLRYAPYVSDDHDDALMMGETL